MQISLHMQESTQAAGINVAALLAWDRRRHRGTGGHVQRPLRAEKKETPALCKTASWEHECDQIESRSSEPAGHRTSRITGWRRRRASGFESQG